MSEPGLSVVIPAYNEATRIHPSLDQVLTYLRARRCSFEVLVADDGSSDGTVEEVRRRGEPEVRVLPASRNEGKGAAVRRGVFASRGELVLVTDADQAISIEEVARFEEYLENGFALACGSRGLLDSRALTPLPFFRVRLGKTFNWIVRIVGLSDFRDTQCGFKLFRGRVAREIFSRCRANGFAYDVESLYIARQLGYRIVEVPVPWRHVPESRVHPLYHAIDMLWEVIRIRVAAWRGHYGAPKIDRDGLVQ